MADPARAFALNSYGLPDDCGERPQCRRRPPISALRVTPAQLETLGGNTHRVCAEVRARNQQLRSSLSPLFGAEWSGAAAAQFAALYDDFDAHARGLADALDGIAGLLIKAGTSYAEVEAQIAASFR